MTAAAISASIVVASFRHRRGQRAGSSAAGRSSTHPDCRPKWRIIFGYGCRGIVIELHCERGAPLADRPQVIHVTEHVHERHYRVDDGGVAAHVLTLDLPAPQIQVPYDGTDTVLRGHHFDLHDRLEQLRPG